MNYCTPVFDKDAIKRVKVVAKGLPASPGAATGQIVFFADDAEAWAEKRKKVIMVRIETSPEDLRGMSVAQRNPYCSWRYDFPRSRSCPWYG